MFFRNAAGHTKKVTTTAVLFIAQCVGNVRLPYINGIVMRIHAGHIDRRTSGIQDVRSCMCHISIRVVTLQLKPFPSLTITPASPLICVCGLPLWWLHCEYYIIFGVNVMVTTHIDRLMGGYLGYLNKKQEQRRIAAGRPGPVLDTVSLT